MELPQEVRYNIEGIDILIRAHLINVGRDFDPLLALVSALFTRLYFNQKGYFLNLLTIGVASGT